jgi:hypothetical protein
MDGFADNIKGEVTAEEGDGSASDRRMYAAEGVTEEDIKGLGHYVLVGV